MTNQTNYISSFIKICFKNGVFQNKAYIIILIFLSSFNLKSQIIFQENFNQPDGTTSGTANGVDWTSTCPFSINSQDYFEVRSGVLEGRDTNGEAEWITDTSIDISNCGSIEISFDIESIGTMEACGTGCLSTDWVSFQYNIDGAGWIDPNNAYYCSGDCASINVIASDDTPLMTYSTGCIPTTGSNLRLRIVVQCWAAEEYWRIDNITVNCSSSEAGTNGNLSICSTASATNLFDQLGGNPINGGTWNGPSNLTGGDLGTFDPATMNPGVYTYTVGSAPCQESATITVALVNNNNAGTDNAIDLCSNAPTLNLFDVLGANPDNGGSWNGPSVLTGGDLGTFDPATMNSGVYTYTVGSIPCQESAAITVNVNSTGNAGSDNSINFCNNALATNLFDQLGGNPDNNGTWSGPSALTGGDLGTFDPATMLEGAYTYTVGNSPCDNSATINVTVSGPIADFTANPTTTTIENTVVEFTNESLNASTYIWSFGDNTTNSADINPFHIFPDFEQGIYTVSLTAFDANNCSNTHSVSIFIIAPEMKYEIPNVFTPNGDSENDRFKLINYQNIKSIEVYVLNRWGNTVFESDVVDFEWNGKVKNNGAECLEGTYFYTINLMDLNGEVIKEHGFIQLAK